ncbi:MAG: GNAT family N-acetyltransferase [Acidimicrobiales bacterium]
MVASEWPYRVEPGSSRLPDGVDGLVAEADAEGVRNVRFLVDRWRDGTARFDGPGEQVLVVVHRSDDAVVGIGGLTACPDVAGALRMRRFYVHPGHRRHGAARTMAAALIDHGLAHTDTLTCNAQASAAAPPFWESLGFRPVERAGITHVLERSAAVQRP